MVVCSLKPKVLLAYLEGAGPLPREKLYISIAAGITLAELSVKSSPDLQMIRVMPNIAASVQKSMSIICPSQSCTSESIQVCRELFDTCGRTRQMPEAQLDIATAICGSGPAFFCTLLEGMVAGAVRMGLTPAVATELVAQTMEGTAEMILASGEHPAVLRDRVTTPAGCTVDGLAVLEEGRIRSLLSKTIEQCALKAKAMGGGK